MTALFVLYVLATTLAGFMGFRDAAGRNGRVDKRRYYVRAVLRALAFAQPMLAALGMLGVGLALIANNPSTVVADVTTAAEPAAMVYAGYTTTVLLSYTPYLVPSIEVRSVVTMAVFGPLTMLQPIVVLAGTATAIASRPTAEVTVFFVAGAVFALGFESLLGWLGWAAKDAQL